MTTISSLMGRMPSLVDYLNQQDGTIASSPLQSLANQSSSGAGAMFGDGGDTVSFSAQAQLLAAQGSGSASSFTPDSDGGEAAMKGAVQFIADFFADSGVDMDKMSEETKTLLNGMGELIGAMGSVARDSTIDEMTKSYVKGQRESFTLQGDGTRLSVTVQYENGKPKNLNVTQVQGTTASTALITLGMDDKGAPSTVEIARVQKTYNPLGGLTGTQAADPLSLSLYV